MSEFTGFKSPQQNWSKLPHQLIDELPRFSSLGELKVVLYVLRHTWGYHSDTGTPDLYKKITLDEFENGRMKADGTRIDSGVGMSRPTIINGIKRAIEDGFLYSHTDNRDAARVKKFYSLTQEGLKSFTPEVKEFNPGDKDSLPRTEKDTKEKDTKEKDSIPDLSGETKSTSNKPKKRDVLFDGILATGFRINPLDCTKDQLSAVAGRVGKIKSKLIKIYPDFKTMTDDEIRADLKAFWKWYQNQHDFDEAKLRSDDKWGEYYLQYHISGRNEQSNRSAVAYYQADNETVSDNERQASLDALKKGDNQS